MFPPIPSYFGMWALSGNILTWILHLEAVEENAQGCSKIASERAPPQRPSLTLPERVYVLRLTEATCTTTWYPPEGQRVYFKLYKVSTNETLSFSLDNVNVTVSDTSEIGISCQMRTIVSFKFTAHASLTNARLQCCQELIGEWELRCSPMESINLTVREKPTLTPTPDVLYKDTTVYFECTGMTLETPIITWLAKDSYGTKNVWRTSGTRIVSQTLMNVPDLLVPKGDVLPMSDIGPYRVTTKLSIGKAGSILGWTVSCFSLDLEGDEVESPANSRLRATVLPLRLTFRPTAAMLKVLYHSPPSSVHIHSELTAECIAQMNTSDENRIVWVLKRLKEPREIKWLLDVSDGSIVEPSENVTSAKIRYRKENDTIYGGVKVTTTIKLNVTYHFDGAVIQCYSEGDDIKLKNQSLTLHVIYKTKPPTLVDFFDGAPTDHVRVMCKALVGTGGTLAWALGAATNNSKVHIWHVHLNETVTGSGRQTASLVMGLTRYSQEDGPMIESDFTTHMTEELYGGSLLCCSHILKQKIHDLSLKAEQDRLCEVHPLRLHSKSSIYGTEFQEVATMVVFVIVAILIPLCFALMAVICLEDGQTDKSGDFFASEGEDYSESRDTRSRSRSKSQSKSQSTTSTTPPPNSTGTTSGQSHSTSSTRSLSGSMESSI